MTSLEMWALFGFVLLAVAVYVLVVTAWLFARCRGRGMAGKPEGDEHSEAPEPPRGRTDARGLWVTEDVREADPGGRTHPIYKKLASLSSEVNSMSRGQLKQRLRDLGLEPRLVHQLLPDSQPLLHLQGDRHNHQQTPHNLPSKTGHLARA